MRIRPPICSLGLLLLAGLLAAAQGPLDGTSVDVTYQGERKQGGGPSQLVFADGKLGEPSIEQRYQFAPGAYSVSRQPEQVAIAATLLSAEHGQVAYAITLLKDGSLSGTRTWSKPNKEPIVHQFSGQLPAKR